MCVIGHSKGAENAIICGQTLNHLVDITISSSSHFGGFINNFTYKGKLQNNAVRPDFKSVWHGFELDDEGFYRSELGQAVLFTVADSNGMPQMIFDQFPDGSLKMNWDVFNSLKNLHQFDTSKIKNFFHFQTLEDPGIMPNAELVKEFTDAMTGKCCKSNVGTILKESSESHEFHYLAPESNKAGCVSLMVVVSILPHAEFGRNDDWTKFGS